MKQMILTTLHSVMLIAAFTTPAFAQDNSGDKAQKIEKRMQNQEKRIEEGKKSGQLNDQEAGRLEKRQERIKAMEEKAKADGQISDEEAKRINKAQNRESRDIKRKKHNKKSEQK